MPKVFISHSWEDNEIVRRLEQYLKRDGAEIWVDYSKIRVGDNVLEEMSKAIEWCDTLVLLWSKTAAKSKYVKIEWTSAVTNDKRVIPCVIDDTKLPVILDGLLYVDFGNFDQGYHNLAQDFKLVIEDYHKEIKSYELPKYYVDVHCQDINPVDEAAKDIKTHSLREMVWEWITNNKPKRDYLQILGDFGTGKTTFCYYIAQEIINKNLSVDVKIIELGQERLDLETKLKAIKDRENTILFLDAYDEYKERGHTAEEFRKLEKITGNFFKVIITSRTNYFITVEDEPNLFTKYLSYFNEQQVQKFLEMKYPANWSRYSKFLKDYQQLYDLSRRVIVLNYLNEEIFESLQKSAKEKDKKLTNYEIYGLIVDDVLDKKLESIDEDLYKLNRNIKRGPKNFIWKNEAIDIMSLLGFNIICCQGKSEIPHDSIRNELSDLVEEFNLENLKKVVSQKQELENSFELIPEVRTRTFLIRNDKGDYRFAHRSFAEYFAARFIIEALFARKYFLGESIPHEVVNLVNEGRGVNYDYKTKVVSGDTIVLDLSTGLMWQKRVSNYIMLYEEAKKWIKELNRKGYAGYHDWRLPTLVEAMSLMEPEKENDRYINPLFYFHGIEKFIWTSDKVKGEVRSWLANLGIGDCRWETNNDINQLETCVRAVRSGQSFQE